MKRFVFFLFLLLFSWSYATDSLVDALTQGTFTHTKAEEVPDEASADEPQKQKIRFHYTSAPLHGFVVEIENNGLDAYAKAFYNDTFLDFGYSLSINNHIANTQTYAMDINYNLRRDLNIGTRYSLTNDPANITSYTRVYSSILVDEIAKGFNIGLSYDKVGLDNKGNNFNLNFKSEF